MARPVLRRLAFVAALLAAAAGGFAVAFLFPKPAPVIPALPIPKPTSEVLARMKAATVFLEIEHPGGVLTTGSGWFGGEPNWIVTNAHVVGRLDPNQPPVKVTAFVNPGVTGKELALRNDSLRVLAVDRDMDLALVQVLNPSAPLPAPLPFRPSATLTELEPLVVLGFPGGRRLAEKNRRTDPPAVSVIAATVGTLRRDAFDNLYAVQVHGGILHGGSGGPVCDRDGNCVGVAQRVDLDHTSRLTGIGYAVPTEYVTGLIAGRAGAVSAGQGYFKSESVAAPVTVHCHDPRHKLTAVGLVAWVGDANAVPRPPGTTRPPSAPNDTDESELPLKYDPKAQAATGELTFPKLPAGGAYWVQPWYSNALVAKQYLAAVKLDAGGAPVTRRAVELGVKYPPDRTWAVQLRRVVELTDADGGESSGLPTSFKSVTDFTATERVTKAAKADLKTAFHRQYGLKDLTPWRSRNGYPEAVPAPLLDLIRKGIPGFSGSGSQSAFGDMPATATESETAEFAPLADPLLSGIQSAFIPLPNWTAQPLGTWNADREVRWSIPTAGFDPRLLLAPPVPATPVRESLGLTYLGVRDQAGRPTAVVAVAGKFASAPGAAVTVSGSMNGEVSVDVETGEVIAATLRRAFALGFAPGRAKQRWTGTEDLSLSRGAAE